MKEDSAVAYNLIWDTTGRRTTAAANKEKVVVQWIEVGTVEWV